MFVDACRDTRIDLFLIASRLKFLSIWNKSENYFHGIHFRNFYNRSRKIFYNLSCKKCLQPKFRPSWYSYPCKIIPFKDVILRANRWPVSTIRFRFIFFLQYQIRNRVHWENYVSISFQFWPKWMSIWFKIERKTVTTIISQSIWKEMEYYFSQCIV